MGNSIWLGGGIKSAFCGGNIKEIWQGSNKIFGGGGKIDEDIVVLYDGLNTYGLEPTRKINHNVYYDSSDFLNFGGAGTPYINNKDLDSSGIQWTQKEIQDIISSKVFTIEFWRKVVSNGGSTPSFIFGRNGTSYWAVGNADYVESSGTNRLYLYINDRGGGKDITYQENINTWSHFAITSNVGATGSATLKAYVNGILKIERTGVNTISTSSNYLYIPNVGRSNLHIAQCCFRNSCKWTENFTPPTKPYILGV